MNELIIDRGNCSQCGTECRKPDIFCGNCGLRLSQSPALVARDSYQSGTAATALPPIIILQPSNLPVIEQALNSRAVVLAILLIAGPIGLPAMWCSRRFSTTAKIVTTLAYMIATVVLPIVAIIYYLEISLWPLVSAFHQ